MSAKETFKRCQKFHHRNPLVYKMFSKQVFRAIDANRSKISAYAIIEWIRWEYYLVTKSEDDYRISNDMKPFYARLFVYEHPQYVALFDFKVKTKVCYGYLDEFLHKLLKKINVDDKGQVNMF